jgi:hypothetical protein
MTRRRQLRGIELRYALTLFGRYAPGEMPRAMEYRIHQRVLDLRAEAAVIASQNDAFWDALLGT